MTMQSNEDSDNGTPWNVESVRIRRYLLENNPVRLADFARSYFALFPTDVSKLDLFISVIRDLGLKIRVLNEDRDPEESGVRGAVLDAIDSSISASVFGLYEGLDSDDYERRIREAAEHYSDFPSTEAFVLVESFVRRNGIRRKRSPAELIYTIEIEELTKLYRVLKLKGFNFERGELVYFVDCAFKQDHTKKLKERLLAQNPRTRREILEAYLVFFEIEDDVSVDALNDFFADNGSAYVDGSDLRKHLAIVREEIELRIFEARLSEDSSVPDCTEIDLFDGYQFESFLKELYSKMGYTVEHTKLSGDQGADLVVAKFGQKTVIQAKCYSGNVGNFAVQEIVAALNLYKATHAMVVTNSYFTPAAIELAAANGVELVDRHVLENLIRKFW